MLRAGMVGAEEVRAAVAMVLASSSHHDAARGLAVSFAGIDPCARFREVVEEMLGGA